MLHKTKALVEAKFTLANGYPGQPAVAPPPLSVAHCALRCSRRGCGVWRHGLCDGQVRLPHRFVVRCKCSLAAQQQCVQCPRRWSWAARLVLLSSSLLPSSGLTALQAAKYVTGHFIKPINLDFEKGLCWSCCAVGLVVQHCLTCSVAQCTFRICSSARSATPACTGPSPTSSTAWTPRVARDRRAPSLLLTGAPPPSGIETVRRDNCPLVKDVITTCLQKILMERDVQGTGRPLRACLGMRALLLTRGAAAGAVDYAKNTISDLLCNRLDISKLVITKAFSKKGEEYAGKQVSRPALRRDVCGA